MFQDVAGSNDFDVGVEEEDIVIRTIDPYCYLNNQSSVQGEPLTTIQGKH